MDLIGNPEDRFSHDAVKHLKSKMTRFANELLHVKTNNVVSEQIRQKPRYAVSE